MTKVLIVDDHALVRQGLAEILRRELKAVKCGEAEDAEQALSQVRSLDWDLVILDVKMPGRSGFDVLPDLKQSRPRLPVLVLSIEGGSHYAKRALKLGASGYICKDRSPQEFVGAVRKVLAGNLYLGTPITT